MESEEDLFSQVGEMRGEAPKTFNTEGALMQSEYKLEFNGFVCPSDFVTEFTPLEFEEVCVQSLCF